MGQTERPATRTISSKSRGFTLLEILLVMAIIAMVMALGLPAIQRVTYQRINSTTRKFVGLVRTVRNDAVLLNTIYRLAIDMDKKTYWIESQREAKRINESTEDTRKKKKGKKGEEPPSNFVMAPKYSKEPIPFPDGVAFDGVFKEREGLINEGTAYIHFFPSGFNEQAILYLKRTGSKTVSYSLVIRPTSGKVDIFQEAVANFDSVPQ